ncbi:hypothetical protein LINGRAHAP2_LOCUS12911 [Linum grandiflorum]
MRMVSLHTITLMRLFSFRELLDRDWLFKLEHIYREGNTTRILQFFFFLVFILFIILILLYYYSFCMICWRFLSLGRLLIKIKC